MDRLIDILRRMQVAHRAWSISVLGLIVALGFGATTGLIATAAEAAPGEGLIVFQRKNVMKGKAIQFNIDQDGRPIGQLKAGTTFQVALAPGSYNFTVFAPSLDGQDFLKINVQAGWTYQVEGIILWGWPTGRPKFKLLSSTPGSAATSGSSGAGEARPDTGTAPAAIAGPALGSMANHPAAGAQADPASEASGKIGLGNFTGEWNLEVWSLARDGTSWTGVEPRRERKRETAQLR
jgi:hypothetical protein